MVIALGIVFLLAGLVLATEVLEYDVPNIDDQGLGILLIVVGVMTIGLALVLAYVANSRRERIERVDTVDTVHHTDRPVVREVSDQPRHVDH